MTIKDWTKEPRDSRLPPWVCVGAEFFTKGKLVVVASDDDEYDNTGEKWRHISVSHKDRLPSWDELRQVRDDFYPADACVIFIFPPVEEYVNFHKTTLHFWWNKDRRLVPKATADAVGPRKKC